MRIHVTWIGEGPEPAPLVAEVAAHVEREFARPAVVWPAEGRPEGSYDARRQQHASRVLLAWLVGRLADPEAKVIGITDLDLFIPVLTFVFGEAQLGGCAAVVSTARLREPAAAGALRARLLKEAVHELGHTFGLVHCASPACVMARSSSIVAVDVKSDRLCGDCRMRLAELMKERAYVTAHSENPDRR